MADFEVKVLRTDDHKRVLQDEGRLTFAVVIGDQEYHQQLSIDEFDTREKIEVRMAEIAAQVTEEVGKKRGKSVPEDIMALVNADPA